MELLKNSPCRHLPSGARTKQVDQLRPTSISIIPKLRGLGGMAVYIPYGASPNIHGSKPDS